MIAQMAARLNAQRTLERALDTVLADSISFVGARKGVIRLVDETGGLVIVAQRGFDRSFLMSMRRITLLAGTASARAAASKTSVVISDVHGDARFASSLDFADRAGFQSVLSTPLVTHTGACVGVISTHFEKPYSPTSIEQGMLLTYGKIAADRIMALLSPDPIAIKAQQLFDRALQNAETTKPQRFASGLRILAGYHHPRINGRPLRHKNPAATPSRGNRGRIPPL